MKTLFYLCLLMLLNFYFVQAQNVEFKKKNFEDSEGFDQAIQNIRKGDAILNQSKTWLYNDAIEYYEKANDFNPNNAKLNLKIGICYLNSNNKSNSLKYFKKAYSSDSKVDAKIFYALAQSNHHNMNWNEAITYYEKYKEQIKDESLIKQLDKKILECESGKQISSNPINVEIQKIEGDINSKFNDHSPFITKDESMIMFTSGRESNSDSYYEHIFYAFKDVNKWGTPDKLGNIISGIQKNDATAGLSLNGKTMFFYKSSVNNGDIYVSNFISNKWSNPTAFSEINSPNQESSACLSPGGLELYFISNRVESIGGNDIFYCIKTPDGNWSNPKNIGATINTIYNEESVFMLNDGKTLLFTSKGHNSIGGYDIFKTLKNESGEWSKPENMGYPLNTTDDETNIFAVGDMNSLSGYFTSYRRDGWGGKDIYNFKFESEDITEKTLATNDIVEPDTIQLTDVIYEDDVNDASTYFANVEEKSTETTEPETDEINDDVSEKSTETTDNETTNDENETTSKNLGFTNSWKIEDMSPKNVVFKIQVGASRKPMGYNELHKRYNGNMTVKEIQHNGWYKYLIGDFAKYQDAKELQASCGVKDAWVITRKNDIRINIREILDFYATYFPLYYKLFSIS